VTGARGAWADRALADAEPRVFWLDDPDRPDPRPSLEAAETADLVVVGGGYTGLWAALRAKERDPGTDVVLVDAGRCGDQASGRNGGFASASLTHGFSNGRNRWPDELDRLDRLGAENLTGIEETVSRHRIDCGWERTGELSVARSAHEAEDLGALGDAMAAAGRDVRLLDTRQVRAEVDSPSYVLGLWDVAGTAMVEPARLAWGLRRAALAAGVRIHEGTPATHLARHLDRVRVQTPHGSVSAPQAVLATNAFPSLLRRLRLMTVPVYDYVLMSEPLSSAQRRAVAGPTGRASATPGTSSTTTG